MPKQRLLIIIAAGLLLALVAFHFIRPAGPNWAKIKPGMTKTEVVARLGQSHREYVFEGHFQQWLYEAGQFIVRYDGEEKVIGTDFKMNPRPRSSTFKRILTRLGLE